MRFVMACLCREWDIAWDDQRVTESSRSLDQVIAHNVEGGRRGMNGSALS